jgi:hypothetical protein
MRHSKTWPMRAWRRVSLIIVTSGAAAFALASLASPNAAIWN